MLTSIITVSACSDDSPSGEPPSIPDLSSVRPTFEFFNPNNKAVVSASGENYQLARSLAQSMEFLMTSFSSLPETYLSLGKEEDPIFNDGAWTWEYSQAFEGESIAIRLEAEQTNTRVNWVMFLSLDTQEESFKNLKMFDGFILNESNEGEWSFYALDENRNSQAIMTYDWVIESEDIASFNFTFDSNSASSLSYVKDSPDNTLTVNGDNETTVLYWNIGTGIGYYDDGSERVCWDSNSNNTPCAGA